MSYARRGRVSIEQVTPDGAVATVQGSEVYTVELSFARDAGELAFSCTCPYAEGDFCKHMWALLVELDRTHGGKLGPAGGQPIEVVLEEPETDEEIVADDEEWEEPSRRHVSSRPRSTRSMPAERIAHPAAPRRRAATWRQRLAVFDAAPGARSRSSDGSALELRLDLEASRERGALVVRFFTRRPRADGSPGGARAARMSRAEAERLVRPEERRIISLLLACARASAPSGFPYYVTTSDYYSASSVELEAAALSAILPPLCRAGCFGLADKSEPLRPLAWDGDHPYRLALEVEPRSKGGGIEARGVLCRDGERIPIEEPLLAHAGGAVVVDGRILMVEERASARELALALRQGGPLEAGERDAGDFLEALAGAAGPDALVLAPELGIAIERGRPRPRVRFDKPDRSSDRLPARIDFRYGDQRVALGVPDRAWMDEERRILLVRDLAVESDAVSQIETAGVTRPGRGAARRDQAPADGEVAAADLAAVVRRLLDAGVDVEAKGAQVRRGGSAALRVRSGIDWFDLEAAIAIDGAPVKLPALLRALREGDGLISLGDGTFGVLPEEWLARFGLLARLGRPEGDAVRFPRAQAALLDALLDREKAVEVDAGFRELRRRLRAHAEVKPRPAPRGFRGALRPYQQAGLGWLRFLEELGLGGCLADDMGLGKTIQVLAHLAGRPGRRRKAGEKDRPSLVVVPKTLLFNWEAEAARFTPAIRLHVHHGPTRTERQGDLLGADLVLTTYGTLLRDVDFFSGLELDYAILDEAQAMKNGRAQTARACRSLPARHRLALTGTPIENRLSDLGSIMEFLNPGMIDASSVLAPLASRGNGDAGDEALALLARAIRPFLLRRTKEAVLTELPAKIEHTVSLELEGKQRRLYQELRDHYRVELLARVEKQGLARSKIHVLEALLRLRQAACHPGLIDKDRREEPSAKLEALIERMVEVVQAGHKALVFSQFTTFLALVRRRLDQAGISYEYLDGKTHDRAARVTAFQEDANCRVFLISLKAGGHGLNLTAADYVFILDPWWNPAAEAQAVDRAHRIGQQRRVFTYRLIAKDTVEEKVLALQADKRRLAEAIVQRDSNLLGQLTSRDLELLLA